jgi:hypothetical protein
MGDMKGQVTIDNGVLESRIIFREKGYVTILS